MSLLLISQAYSISDDEYEATKGSEVQIKEKNGECNINSGNHCKSQKVKRKNSYRPIKQLKPRNQNETEKKNAALFETSPNLFEQWPFYECKIVFKNKTTAGIKIDENTKQLGNVGWKQQNKNFVFYEELTAADLANSKGARKKSITTSDKIDVMKDENEDKIFTPSFLDLLDQMENKIFEKTTVEKNIVANKPPSTKKRRLENNHLNVSVNSGKDVNFEVCDKLPPKKTLAPNQCIMCYKQLDRPSHFERHILTHIKEKPFSCNVCNESFALFANLKSHKNIHKGEKTFCCMICNKRFNQSINLKAHQRIHSREKPFQCSVCSASFSHSSNLKQHQRTHTGERPYQCTICSKRFVLSTNLREHQRVHTKEKPFECILCGKRFAWKRSLRRHAQSHN